MKGAFRLAVTWLLLMALLTVTVTSTFVPLGFGNTLINLAVAFAKASLIVLVFMEVARGPSLPRLVVGAAALWLAILFVLSWIGLRGV
jgi:cytochrome c oxidase subunit 4